MKRNRPGVYPLLPSYEESVLRMLTGVSGTVMFYLLRPDDIEPDRRNVGYGARLPLLRYKGFGYPGQFSIYIHA